MQYAEREEKLWARREASTFCAAAFAFLCSLFSQVTFGVVGEKRE